MISAATARHSPWIRTSNLGALVTDMSYAYLINDATRHRQQPVPLSHHEIIGLTEPFTRRGYHVDLAASDRGNRRLVFKPVAHDNEAVAALANAREVLRLDNPRPGLYSLSRVVTLGSGLEAMLQTAGEQPGELLARLQTMPWQDQFRAVAEAMVAHSYRLLPSAKAGPGAAASIMRELTRGEAEVAGFTVVLHAVTVKGYPADLDLIPRVDCPELPDDLLAVLGWAWGPLSKRSDTGGWRCKLRVSGKEPYRSRQMEARLERTVAHLGRTLAKPPSVFHDTQIGARWGVTFRRAIPLLLVIALIASACALCFVEIPQNSIVNMLIQSSPPLLLFAIFGMRDIPKLEFPPIPRRATAISWLVTPSEPPAAMAIPDLRSAG